MVVIVTYPDVTGFIIAGGKSRRMGFDKRQIRVNGVPLLERMRNLLRDVLGREPVFVGDNLSSTDISILHDAKVDCGPVGGLVAALENCRTEWALILAVDLPYLSSIELALLLGARNENYDVILFSSDDRVEPLAALYNANNAEFWRGRLEKKELCLRDGFKNQRCLTVKLQDDSRALENINEPWQLAGLL
ncbi:MAG: hypothetical protein A2W25_13275 [candidate division Zixibacteria bacterium RBG_16_53_22]|nr:MAG: hypothetical protein A2W25_13275 [candidate division Zixibacteria bacterium RBG_16_53_22]